ncbi:short-chain dehydrogenase/reductase SDR [Spiroplasma gladiatoris]|uniref:Short-chain dehydrogenase/reductase SDR n=1 Tax=Spiroplasma gladiatoris TaxID=2143 RepID=A0A4P7AKI4_9MOLU|nr:SDR family NAD(P)-dependent oxidoreductase [Spiroplasma gladiatoris]QBQ08070.1 short-chain dehydrogenase/reductase SDR [Spiroplasma gladiatoris]
MAKKIKLLNKYAVVTGASKGLGYEYCKELLKKGYNIIGVARNASNLNNLKTEFVGQKIIAWNFDLSVFENNVELIKKCQDYDTEIFINNAGYGVWGFFTQSDVDQEMNMIELNIKSLHYLTKKMIIKFDEQGYGRVINVGSMAAFTPGPVFASYYASKAYVFSLGLAINTELKKTKSKARVLTVCPGPLKTDFWNRSSNQKEAKYKSTIKVMSTSTYAKKSLNTALKTNKKDYIVTGLTNKLVKKITKWAPLSITLSSVYKYQKNRK